MPRPERHHRILTAAQRGAPILLLALLLGAPQNTRATELSAAAGPTVFDLASVGVTTSASFRVSQPIIRWVAIEAALGIAIPKQRDDDRATLYMPEAGLRLTWPFDRWSPYIAGAVGGVAFVDFGSQADWDVSVSGAIGAVIPRRNRLSFRPEIRIHGFGDSLSAAITDFHIGLVFHL